MPCQSLEGHNSGEKNFSLTRVRLSSGEQSICSKYNISCDPIKPSGSPSHAATRLLCYTASQYVRSLRNGYLPTRRERRVRWLKRGQGPERGTNGAAKEGTAC